MEVLSLRSVGRGNSVSKGEGREKVRDEVVKMRLKCKEKKRSGKGPAGRHRGGRNRRSSREERIIK